MRPRNSQYVPEDSVYPFEGVDLLSPGTQVDSHYFTEAQNIDVSLGHLSKRKGSTSMSTVARIAVASITRAASTATVTTTLAHGYTTGNSITISGADQAEYNGTFTITVTGATTFTYTVAGTPATPATGTIKSANSITGTVLAVVEFIDEDNVTHRLLFTTTREYKFNGTDWDDITFRTVAPVYTSRTGDEEDGLDYVIATGRDSTGAIKTWIIITNGVDKPRYWDGILPHFFEYSTATVANKGAGISYTGFVTCKTLATMNGYLILGNITTSAPEPNVLVWANTASLVNFDDGNAGAVQLVDVNRQILKLLQLGDRMMIYSEETLHHMIHVGGFDVFAFERVLSEIRLLSQRGVVDLGMFHVFMAQEKIQFYDGTRQLRSMSEAIRLRYRDVLQPSLKTRAWAFHDKPRSIVYFGVPKSESETLIFKCEYDTYDVRKLRWMPETYAQRVTAIGFFSRDTNLAYNSPEIATTLYTEVAMSYSAASLNAGFPQRVLGHVAAVSLSNDTVYNDGSTAVNALFESPDFTVPQSFLSEDGRLVEIEFEGRGDEVTVEYSIDKGLNFKTLKTVILANSWRQSRVFLDKVSPVFRVRFRNATLNKNYEIRWYRAWVSPAGVVGQSSGVSSGEVLVP